MIALNEADEYAAEVPFTLPLATDPLTGLTGWSFSLGEVQIRLPGAGAWINVALAKIVEKGYGRFCARLTSAQTTTAGIVSVLANVTGATEQPYVGTETIGQLGGDVPVNGTGYFMFDLPDSVDPVYASPITTANFTASGVVRICLPNASYRDATLGELNAIVNLGNGLYAFALTTAHTATKGKIFLYVTYPGAQRFEGYSEVLGIGAAAPAASVTPLVSRVISPITYGDPTYVDHARAAINRLPEQFRSGSYVPAGVGLDTLLGAELG